MKSLASESQPFQRRSTAGTPTTPPPPPPLMGVLIVLTKLKMHYTFSFTAKKHSTRTIIPINLFRFFVGFFKPNRRHFRRDHCQ